MVEKAKQSELGNGLPRCLNGLLKLQKPLYLDRGPRKRLLKGNYVRHRLDAGLRGASDRDIMLAFYGNAKNRRDLWSHWRERFAPRPGSARKPTGHGSGDTPPSLEYCVLDALDREFLRSESSDDIVLDRLKAEVESRLGTWSEADEEERGVTTLLTFTLASLTNDRSVLANAVERTEDLREEFGDLLRPPATDADPPDDCDAAPDTQTGTAPSEHGTPTAPADAPDSSLLWGLQQVETTIESAFSSLSGLVEKVEDAESLEIFGGFATSVEDRLQILHGGLTERRRQLESGRTVEELQAAAAKFLGDIGKHAAAAGIQADVIALADTWADLSDVHPPEATAELARLRSEVPTAIKTLEQIHAEYGRLVEERDELRDHEPTSREEQLNLDDRLDALHEQRVAVRKRLRAAEDALLTALAPGVKKPDQPASAPTATAEQPLLDSQFSANRDLFDGTDAEEAANHAGAGVRVPPAAEARSKSDDDDQREAETDEGSETSPNEASTEANEADPPAERVQPAETGKLKTMSAPATAPTASGAEPAAFDATAPEGAAEDDPVEAPPEPPAPERTEVEQSVRNALVDALADEPPRLAEAFQVCRLAEELEIAAGQPRSSIVEAALYASHLRQAHGELAADLREVIENAPSEPPPGGTPAQENAEALLRFAGAVVPALLAPHTGAAAWLKGLTHEGLLALYDFAQQAAERSWAAQTAGIDAGSFLRRAGRHLKHGDAMAAVQQDLASWHEGDATLPLGYVPAKKVWSAFLKKGPLGRLLRAIANRADATDVRRHLADIQNRDRLRRCLDDLSAQLLKKNQSIDQKIFKQIRRRLDRPCELAHEYLSLREARTDQASYHRQILSEFVRLIREDAPGLHEELQTVRARQDADPLVRAASNVASCALIQVENLVDPELEAGGIDEPAADMVRASGLFLYPEVRVTDSGLAEGDATEALKALLGAPVLELETALQRRVEAADLLTAQRILDWPASKGQTSDDDWENWQERLDSSREEHLRSLTDDVETLRDALESAYLYGQLAPDDRLELDIGLSSLEDGIEDGTVVRFDRSVAELDHLRRDLERAKSESLQALRSEARDRVPTGEQDRLREIERHIDDGDLVAANELLFRSSEPVPRLIQGTVRARSSFSTPTSRLIEASCAQRRRTGLTSSKPRRRAGAIEFSPLTS